ncbi:MAG: Gfo/Idh/MocA family oxidoreductase [Anaerolineae bacterium]|nr:Gfo/Idh/MocA family oxidoreductase [Anaerolineae bacterium]
MTTLTRVGIIGAGAIARHHVMAYQRVPDVKVVAVADIIPGKAEEFAREWDIPQFFENHQDLLALDEIDAVSVCTYNQAHRQPTVDALKANKHVLVEKPLAATLDDAIAMIRAANESDKILHTGFWQRWQPEVQTARHIVESGTLGEIYYAQMVGGRRHGIPGGTFLRRELAGAGPVVDIGCYSLDTLMFLTDSPRPVSVSAMVSYRLGNTIPNVLGDWGHNPADVNVEDFGTAFVRFENGMVLHFVTYWVAHADSLGPSILLGDCGGLQLSPKLTLFRDEFGTMTDVQPQIPDLSEPMRIHHFLPQARIFVDAVRKGGPSPIDLRGIYMNQLIMDGMFRSGVSGGEVTIDAPAFEAL